MQKPFSVARTEFTNELIRLVNDSGLPPSVLADIVSNLAGLLNQKAQTLFEEEQAAYEKALRESQKGKEKKKK